MSDGSLVGRGYIQIGPSMRGFRKKVDAEVSSSASSGARKFTDRFRSVGESSGQRLGRGLKASFDSSSGKLGVASLRGLQDEVAKAAQRLSRSRLKQQDEAGRVRVAEARLAEAVKKSGAESARAVAAEESLAAARRRQQVAVEAVSSASARLQSAQQGLAGAAGAASSAAAKSSARFAGVLSDFREGFRSSAAATSTFSGLSAALGGLTRSLVKVTGFERLGRMAAAASSQVYARFTTLATLVGGRIASMRDASSSWLRGVRGDVVAGLRPAVVAASVFGQRLATPFVKLGGLVSNYLSPVKASLQNVFARMPSLSGPVSSIVSSFRSGLAQLPGIASSAVRGVATAFSGLRPVATGIVAGVSAALGTALFSGFGRLTSIDVAQAKLRGFGRTAADITAIMSDAMTSVRGTSFGLGEAATVAAAAVAANIRPGEQLQRHLANVANNASAAGLSMAEMGRIFNKAATQANGVQNDVISQLADRGIPIYQALADQMGVTAGEVFKMASQGKVDFETFSRAAQAAAGTVAKEMGTTVPGAAKNLMASLGRIGANLIGGLGEGTFYSKLGPLIQSVTNALGPLEDRAKAVGQGFNRLVGPGMDRLTEFFNSVGKGTSSLSGLVPALGAVGGGVTALGAGGLATLLARVPLLSGLLPGLGAALSALGGPLGVVAAAIAGVALTGGDFGAVADSITNGVNGLVAALPGMVAGLVQLVPTIITGIISMLPALIPAALQILNSLVQGLIAALPLLIDGALQLVTALVQGLIASMPLLIEGAVQLLSGLVQGLIAALPLLIDAALQLVTTLVTMIAANLPLIIQAGISLLLSLVLGIIGALPELITAALTSITTIVTVLIQNLPLILDAGVKILLAVISGLVGAIPQLLAAVPKIISAIWDTILKVDWLDLGVKIIQGLISGIASMAGAVWEAIKKIVGGIADFFPRSPAKRGPLSGKGYPGYSGGKMLSDFADGMRDKSGLLEAASRDAAAAASFTADARYGSTSAAAEALLANSTRPINVLVKDKDDELMGTLKTTARKEGVAPLAEQITNFGRGGRL